MTLGVKPPGNRNRRVFESPIHGTPGRDALGVEGASGHEFPSAPETVGHIINGDVDKIRLAIRQTEGWLNSVTIPKTKKVGRSIIEELHKQKIAILLEIYSCLPSQSGELWGGGGDNGVADIEHENLRTNFTPIKKGQQVNLDEDLDHLHQYRSVPGVVSLLPTLIKLNELRKRIDVHNAELEAQNLTKIVRKLVTSAARRTTTDRQSKIANYRDQLSDIKKSLEQAHKKGTIQHPTLDQVLKEINLAYIRYVEFANALTRAQQLVAVDSLKSETILLDKETAESLNQAKTDLEKLIPAYKFDPSQARDQADLTEANRLIEVMRTILETSQKNIRLQATLGRKYPEIESRFMTELGNQPVLDYARMVIANDEYNIDIPKELVLDLQMDQCLDAGKQLARITDDFNNQMLLGLGTPPGRHNQLEDVKAKFLATRLYAVAYERDLERSASGDDKPRLTVDSTHHKKERDLMKAYTNALRILFTDFKIDHTQEDWGDHLLTAQDEISKASANLNHHLADTLRSVGAEPGVLTDHDKKLIEKILQALKIKSTDPKLLSEYQKKSKEITDTDNERTLPANEMDAISADVRDDLDEVTQQDKIEPRNVVITDPALQEEVRATRLKQYFEYIQDIDKKILKTRIADLCKNALGLAEDWLEIPNNETPRIARGVDTMFMSDQIVTAYEVYIHKLDAEGSSSSVLELLVQAAYVAIKIWTDIENLRTLSEDQDSKVLLDESRNNIDEYKRTLDQLKQKKDQGRLIRIGGVSMSEAFQLIEQLLQVVKNEIVVVEAKQEAVAQTGRLSKLLEAADSLIRDRESAQSPKKIEQARDLIHQFNTFLCNVDISSLHFERTERNWVEALVLLYKLADGQVAWATHPEFEEYYVQLEVEPMFAKLSAATSKGVLPRKLSDFSPLEPLIQYAKKINGSSSKTSESFTAGPDVAIRIIENLATRLNELPIGAHTNRSKIAIQKQILKWRNELLGYKKMIEAHLET